MDKHKLYIYEQAIHLTKRKRKQPSEDAASDIEPQPVKKEDKVNKKKRKKVKGRTRKPGASDGLSEEELLKKFSNMDLTKMCPLCEESSTTLTPNAITRQEDGGTGLKVKR